MSIRESVFIIILAQLIIIGFTVYSSPLLGSYKQERISQGGFSEKQNQ